MVLCQTAEENWPTLRMMSSDVLAFDDYILQSITLHFSSHPHEQVVFAVIHTACKSVWPLAG